MRRVGCPETSRAAIGIVACCDGKRRVLRWATPRAAFFIFSFPHFFIPSFFHNLPPVPYIYTPWQRTADALAVEVVPMAVKHFQALMVLSGVEVSDAIGIVGRESFYAEVVHTELSAAVSARGLCAIALE